MNVHACLCVVGCVARYLYLCLNPVHSTMTSFYQHDAKRKTDDNALPFSSLFFLSVCLFVLQRRCLRIRFESISESHMLTDTHNRKFIHVYANLHMTTARKPPQYYFLRHPGDAVCFHSKCFLGANEVALPASTFIDYGTCWIFFPLCLFSFYSPSSKLL